MSIYDVVFYGIVCQSVVNKAKIIISEKQEDLLFYKKENSFGFKINILNEFEGKRDVMCLSFEDGTCAYETLYSPTYHYVNGSWVFTERRDIQEVFLEAYVKSKRICFDGRI